MATDTKGEKDGSESQCYLSLTSLHVAMNQRDEANKNLKCPTNKGESAVLFSVSFCSGLLRFVTTDTDNTVFNAEVKYVNVLSLSFNQNKKVPIFLPFKAPCAGEENNEEK